MIYFRITKIYTEKIWEKNMKNVIVTGASGFIGTTLVKELLNRDYRVIAIDREFTDAFLNNPNVICIEATNKNISDLKNEIPEYGYNCCFHLAWASTSGQGRADYSVQLANAKMACDYVKLCSEIGCKRVVYASSINEMETYEYLQGDDIEPTGGYIYGTGKLAAHLMGETARIIYTSLVKLINGERASFTAGYQTYDFIYITDAINSIVEVSEKGKPFNRYYIGSGQPKALREYLLEMRDIVSPGTELGLGDFEFKGTDISYSQFKL